MFDQNQKIQAVESARQIKGLYRGYIGFHTGYIGFYRGYIGILETTIIKETL